MESGYIVGDIPGLRRTFFVIHVIGGQVGMPLMVLTFLLSKKLLRHPSLINFCITWIIYSVTYCLILYGDVNHLRQPDSQLCVVQAALIHGGPPMVAMAGLILIVHIWAPFQDPLRPCFDRIPGRLLITLGSPYLTFGVFSITSGILGLQHPKDINSANGLYCTLYLDPFQRYGVPLFVLVTMAAISGFEVVIAAQYIRQWRHIKQAFPLANRQITNPSFCFRILVFTLYSWVTILACALFLSETSSALRHMVPAALPLAALVVFGTQKDLFLTWYFWRPKNKTQNPLTDQMPTARSPSTGVVDNS